MRSRNTFIRLLTALLLGACAPGAPSRTATSAPVSPVPAAGGTPIDPFSAAVLEGEYQLGLSDQIRTVPLSGGRFQQGERGEADFLSVFVTGFMATGDLDEDGAPEVAALVTESYGGSGSFVFLTVFQDRGQGPRFLTSTFLDDRPIIESLSIVEGEVRVGAVVHDFDDPMCCPTLSTSRAYRLSGNSLELRRFSTLTPTGRPRAITLSAPQEGEEVSGSVQVAGGITIAPFENTLVYRLYDMGGVELSAGPVNVDAPDLGAPGTFRQTIDLGAILANTTVRIEVQDLSAADGSLIAMDSVLVQVR